MSNIKDREKFDEYEMKDEYDFSGGVKGRFYKPKKIPTTLRLDDDILLYFKKKQVSKKYPIKHLSTLFYAKSCKRWYNLSSSRSSHLDNALWVV